MFEKKTPYIEQLLNEIKSLHESVLEVSNSGSLPFSFFKESFNRTQEITGILHKLEFMQVEDLKNQMERLVLVLSEKEKEKQLELSQNQAQSYSKDKEQESPEVLVHSVLQANNQEGKPELPEIKDDEPIRSETEFDKPNTGNKYAEGIALPEYRNPQHSDHSQQIKREANIPSFIDLKRGISLNDRFLFQRELFGNDRHRMNSTIEKLNQLETYEEVEEFIRENVSADLENPTVIDFLFTIKKGFK